MCDLRNEFESFVEKFLRIWPPHMAVVRAYESIFWRRNVDLSSPVLDLGCGDGKFTSIVFGKLDVGLDISSKEVQRAQSQGAYDDLHCGDALKIPYPDDYFNSIVSNCVLEHIPHPESLIREIARVLRVNGEFLFTTWTPLFSQSLLLSRKWYVKWKNKRNHHVSLKSFQEWEAILQDNGLETVESENYIDPGKLRNLDLLELVSLLGVWKFRMINVYKLLAPHLPDFVIKGMTRSLGRFYTKGNKDNGCAVFIRAQKMGRVNSLGSPTG